MAGIKAFFARVRKLADVIPERVQTDRLASYPLAVKEALAEAVEQVLPCTANAVEQILSSVQELAQNLRA